MAEQPFDDHPVDEPDSAAEIAVEPDNAIEGTVVLFPGAAPPPAPRKAKFGEVAELRPILPEHLRTVAAARKHYGWHAKRARHHSLYHLVRLPSRAANTVRWAALGLLKLGWIELNWWWVTEQTYLRSQAVRDNDPRTWESLHKHAIKRRAFRGSVLGVQRSPLPCSSAAGSRSRRGGHGWPPPWACCPRSRGSAGPMTSRYSPRPACPWRTRRCRSRWSCAPWKDCASRASTRHSARTGRTPSCSSTRSSATGRAGWPGSTCRSA